MLSFISGSFMECQKWYEYVAVTGIWLFALSLVISFISLIGFGIYSLCSSGIVGILLSILILFWLICLIAWFIRSRN